MEVCWFSLTFSEGRKCLGVLKYSRWSTVCEQTFFLYTSTCLTKGEGDSCTSENPGVHIFVDHWRHLLITPVSPSPLLNRYPLNPSGEGPLLRTLLKTSCLSLKGLLAPNLSQPRHPSCNFRLSRGICSTCFNRLSYHVSPLTLLQTHRLCIWYTFVFSLYSDFFVFTTDYPIEYWIFYYWHYPHNITKMWNHRLTSYNKH